ncbi:probable aspartyl protease At4g16563 [Fagus crenata]
MAALSLLSLIFVFSTLSFLASSSSLSIAPKPTTFTLPLSPIYTKHSSSDSIETFNSLASTSLTRARHLKGHKSNLPDIKTQVSSQSYGDYAISLSFGTPPQTIPFILDTGSSPVWFPCTARYYCTNCDFPDINPKKIPSFFPKLSSSSKFLDCQNPKCAWFPSPPSQNCSRTCPYTIYYGSGSTLGTALFETLNFPQKAFTNFIVGCSVSSNHIPTGIAGFGRTPESLPSQLGLSKFSYCLISRSINDTSKSSDLVLYRGSSSDATTSILSYTPFQNPVSNISAFRNYYYLNLRKVIVGGKFVNIPNKYLVPDGNGNGGTIVDSGSSITFMEKPVFEAMAHAFETQMANFSRATTVELENGLWPCFNLTGVKSGTVKYPSLTFQFEGGAKLELPHENYFSDLNGNSSGVCLMIYTDNEFRPENTKAGPAIILGNFQQQNFYVEYDLENERFGFRKQNC